jgi:glyoxylase-like metal-dependent hydrolase (beta-lactamase superfamily II)
MSGVRLEQLAPGAERIFVDARLKRSAVGYFAGALLVEPVHDLNRDAAVLVALAKARGVKAVVVTHWHSDHTRRVALLARLLDVDLLAPVGGCVRCCSMQCISDGDTVHGWRVFSTPGHSHEHVVLCDGRTLVAGDMLGDEIAVPDVGGDRAAFRCSLDLIDSLRAKIALVGHGAVSHDVGRSVALAAREVG